MCFLLLRLSAHTATDIPPEKNLCFIFITRDFASPYKHTKYFFDREQLGSVGVSVANWTDVGRDSREFNFFDQLYEWDPIIKRRNSSEKLRKRKLIREKWKLVKNS